MSLHPPHLLDSRGQPTPAAFIPFCAYQTKMTLLGQRDGDLPICTHFQPTQMRGQLCYSINSTSLAGLQSQTGVDKGLVFFLDLSGMGGKRFMKTKYNPEDKHKIQNLVLGDTKTNQRAPRIHIETMTRFKDYNAGVFKMSSLKSTSGSERFLALPHNIRECDLEPYEDCYNRGVMEDVLKQCGCIPWFISPVQESKVICLFFYTLKPSRWQNFVH